MDDRRGLTGLVHDWTRMCKGGRNAIVDIIDLFCTAEGPGVHLFFVFLFWRNHNNHFNALKTEGLADVGGGGTASMWPIKKSLILSGTTMTTQIHPLYECVLVSLHPEPSYCCALIGAALFGPPAAAGVKGLTLRRS